MAEEEKKFAKAGGLKPGSYVLIDDSICQVRSVEKSKPGKHGAAKVRVVAFDIFTGAKKGLLKPADADINIPIIKKGTAQVVAVLGENVQVMDVENYEMFTVKKPEDVSGLESGVEVEYHQYGKNIKIVRKKGT